MSNIINKVKDTLTGHTNDPHHTSTTSTTHHNPTSTTTAGPHSSNIANKADPRVDSDLDGSRNMGARHTDNYGSTTAGPHSSNLANKADPRVDSDLDGSRNMGAHGAGHTGGLTGGHTGGLTGGHNTHSTGTTGLTGGHNTTHSTGTTGAFGSSHTGGSTNAGPHSSNLANKADPLVDSDLDGSRNMGARGTGHTGGLTGGHNTHSTGTTGLTGGHNTHGTGATHTGSSTTAGPHSSNLANKVDPRVDSDLDGSRNMGARDTTHSSGLTGGHTGGLTGGHNTHSTGTGAFGSSHTGGSTNAGPHSSNLANKADPRVDSDLDGSRNMGARGTGTTGTHTGSTHTAGTSAAPLTNSGSTTHPTSHGTHQPVISSGPAPNTAGPHKSDIMNKLDPRVDSDLDGSKTIGGDKTHSGTTGTTGHY
jgi:hypothetical protein